MIILINGGPALDRFGPTRLVGRLISPRSGNVLTPGQLWAADNDAFLAWDEGRFRRMLNRVAIPCAAVPDCLFVSVPDVVGDARATLDRFGPWRDEIASRGLPVALVGQDGAEDVDLPWDLFCCLFVGGSTGWKLSSAAADLAVEAKSRGKWVHVGRVNSRKRLRICRLMHADSVDGTGWSKFPDKYLKRDIPLVANLNDQGLLF